MAICNHYALLTRLHKKKILQILLLPLKYFDIFFLLLCSGVIWDSIGYPNEVSENCQAQFFLEPDLTLCYVSQWGLTAQRLPYVSGGQYWLDILPVRTYSFIFAGFLEPNTTMSRFLCWFKEVFFSTESNPSHILRSLYRKMPPKYLNVMFLPIVDFGNCWILQLKFITLRETS